MNGTSLTSLVLGGDTMKRQKAAGFQPKQRCSFKNGSYNIQSFVVP